MEPVPEDRDESDDEQEADLNPVEVCRYCGLDCGGACDNPFYGMNTP